MHQSQRSRPQKGQKVMFFSAGAFSVLNRFFLLFQMHTTAERAYTDNNMFGTQGCYSFLRMMVSSLDFGVNGIRTCLVVILY